MIDGDSVSRNSTIKEIALTGIRCSRKRVGTFKNTMIVDETETKEEKGKVVPSACIIEEINFGKAIESNTAREAKNGIALDTGCTSSVVGERWLKE